MEGAARGFRPAYGLIGGGAFLLVILFCSPILLGLLAVMSTTGGMTSSGTEAMQPSPNVDGAIPVPKALIPVYEAAGQKYNVTWTVLAAIHYVETNFSMGDSPTSSKGAEGPMQFEPSTFAEYGVTAPGQSCSPNIQNLYDAIYTAAHYLSANGFAQNPDQAIFQYNHAGWYVEEVMSDARQIGSISAIHSSRSPLGANTYNTIMSDALQYQGYPYVFGGASPQTSFDCSGLTQWVYGKAGIQLPRTAQAQYDATKHISESQAKPGDLVFFSGTYEANTTVTHVGIYVGGNMMYDADNEGVGYHALTGYWTKHLYGYGRVKVIE
ncbi:NlpC/P60 family protein [Alicyclobacillus fodiniaquatilis]|uniref:NlpC/P60 family protein n=1 Tax=Alicyclobacillus fodiniaquatilis TaxID=1661150 RepID=A0ABW4JH11_9BACL